LTGSTAPDAKAAAEAVKKQKCKGFFSVSYSLSSTTTQKRPVGNPGKNPKPPKEVTTWHVKFTISENSEVIEAAKKQAQSFVLITNIPSKEMDNQTLLWRYKQQYVVEAGFRWLRQPSMASTIFLKKPERIEALMMLIHVALMIRALMQQQARLRVKEAKHVPLIDLNGQKLTNPTADKILVLLINHAVITDGGGEHYYADCLDKDFERLQTLLNLLGITEEELLVAE
jgi:transposase